MSTTDTPQVLSNRPPIPAPTNSRLAPQAPRPPQAPQTAQPATVSRLWLWLCVTSALAFCLSSFVPWLDTYNRLRIPIGPNGSSYFLLGDLSGALLFVGFVAWLAISHKLVPIKAKEVPSMPRWVPLVVAGYGWYAIVAAVLALISAPSFKGTTSSNSVSTEPSFPFMFAILCLAVLTLGAIRYWRGYSPRKVGATSTTTGRP